MCCCLVNVSVCDIYSQVVTLFQFGNMRRIPMMWKKAKWTKKKCHFSLNLIYHIFWLRHNNNNNNNYRNIFICDLFRWGDFFVNFLVFTPHSLANHSFNIAVYILNGWREGKIQRKEDDKCKATLRKYAKLLSVSFAKIKPNEWLVDIL